MEPRLDHLTVRIRQIVEDYRAGRIVIPEFQRDYVWRKSKAPLLLDSLFHSFPISSLLMWSSADEVRPRRRGPAVNRNGTVQWLIDGQQRVITLSKILSGDDGIETVFNPDTTEFRLANAATRKDPTWVRVADIFDDEAYRRIRRSLDGTRADERREVSFEAVRRILDYEIPVVKMVDHSFGDAVKAFERINTLGIRLRKEDIESAQVAARHTGFIADEAVPFLAEVRGDGFTRLNIMHLFRACAFIAHPDGRRRTPLHELERREVAKAWTKTKRATKDAIALLRGQLGLVDMDILWSGNLLVPVIALCAELGNEGRSASEIAGWLALAALTHRYSGATDTALDQDLKACRANDPLGALLANLRQTRQVLLAHESDFTGALADRGGILAMYVACYQQGIRDFLNGDRLVLHRGLDRHHILPRGQFPAARRSSADCIANIAFISGSGNRAINMTGPEVYIPRIAEDVRRSQCIPEESALWRISEASGFWAARRELLAESFNEFLRVSLPNRRL
jgi:hypothetical protein